MTIINRITRDDVRNFTEQAIGYPDSVDPLGNAIDAYQKIATKSAIYPGQGTPLGLAYVALKLNGEAGEFAEHVGKAMRDDGLISHKEGSVWGPRNKLLKVTSFGELTSERHTALLKEIGDILWYASAACNELDTTLSQVATMNLEKLCDRCERDALRGSGDDR